MVSQNNYVRYTNKYIFTNDLYKKYISYAKYINKLNITLDTKEWRLKHIRGFLNYLEKNNKKLNEILAIDIYNYMSSINKLSARTKEHRAVCIRFFINWLYDNNEISFNGYQILPKIKCNKNEKIITYYNNQEISKMLNSININENNGKRDLIIMLLFARLGLRERDVQNLKLENINWTENKIIIVQSKNNFINNYPMTNEIRYALIDYLKSERPASNLSFIFLKDKDNIYSNHFYYNLVSKYLKKANINTTNKKCGSHSLRHSLAISLINDDNSIYITSSILGHKNPNDTKMYARVNIKKLKIIPLEVPVWKN